MAVCKVKGGRTLGLDEEGVDDLSYQVEFFLALARTLQKVLIDAGLEFDYADIASTAQAELEAGNIRGGEIATSERSAVATSSAFPSIVSSNSGHVIIPSLIEALKAAAQLLEDSRCWFAERQGQNRGRINEEEDPGPDTYGREIEYNCTFHISQHPNGTKILCAAWDGGEVSSEAVEQAFVTCFGMLVDCLCRNYGVSQANAPAKAWELLLRQAEIEGAYLNRSLKTPPLALPGSPASSGTPRLARPSIALGPGELVT